MLAGHVGRVGPRVGPWAPTQRFFSFLCLAGPGVSHPGPRVRGSAGPRVRGSAGPGGPGAGPDKS